MGICSVGSFQVLSGGSLIIFSSSFGSMKLAVTSLITFILGVDIDTFFLIWQVYGGFLVSGMSACWSLFPYICQCGCTSINVPIFLSIHLYIHQYIHMSVCPLSMFV